MAEVKLTKQNFDITVLHSQKPVLVDFFADWCGPCKMLSPIIAEIAREYDGRVIVGKVNVDEEMELARNYQIASIPTILLFQNGKVVKKSIGLVSKEKLLKMLK